MRNMRYLTTFVLLIALFAMMGQAAKEPTTAKEAWEQLVGPRGMRNPSLAYVANQPGLPNVLIYGDSISMQFGPDLRETLKGKANVYRIHCNGGDSSSFIEKMDTMHQTMRNPKLKDHWTHDWDVIQFNLGLHDLKYTTAEGRYDVKNGKQVIPPDQYEKNLKNIVEYLRKTHPTAKLIYCTTTPVPENSSGRVAGDAAKYNVVAVKVMKEMSKDKKHAPILINDLYTFTKPHHDKWCASPGNVHFNAEGRKAQGEEVARVVMEAWQAKQKASKGSK